MKKFLSVIAACLTLAVNACWISGSSLDFIYLARVNTVDRVISAEGDYCYSSGFAVSLPCSVGMLQNLPAADRPGIVQAKLQYSVYRATNTSDVQDVLDGWLDLNDLTCRKVVPWQTVCTLGNGSSVLPMTSDQIINYFGSYRIRPNRKLLKQYDLIVIRVWMTDGFINSGDLVEDLSPALFRREMWSRDTSSLGLGNTGWYPNFAVCVIFNGKWGAR